MPSCTACRLSSPLLLFLPAACPPMPSHTACLPSSSLAPFRPASLSCWPMPPACCPTVDPPPKCASPCSCSLWASSPTGFSMAMCPAVQSARHRGTSCLYKRSATRPMHRTPAAHCTAAFIPLPLGPCTTLPCPLDALPIDLPPCPYLQYLDIPSTPWTTFPGLPSPSPY